MSNIYQAKGKTLVDQYEDVGRLFAHDLQKRIRQSKIKKIIAIKVLTRIYDIERLELFCKCFEAWARGAGITKQKAMYLLVDNLVGCQTLMVRYMGGVGLIHTEEDFDDPIARMKGEHTIEFSDNGRKLFTLNYNNLLPGAALYGWQPNMLFAVDALFLREDYVAQIEQPMLANIIGWIIWQMKPEEADPQAIASELSELGELVDGYAVNVVRKISGKISGFKICFARNDWVIEELGEKDGDYLGQVNIFDASWSKQDKPIVQWQASRKEIEDYPAFLDRQVFLQKFAQELLLYFEKQVVGSEIMHKSIMKLIYAKYKSEFVNEWMGAAVVGVLDSNSGVSVSCKLNNDHPISELEYISKVE